MVGRKPCDPSACNQDTLFEWSCRRTRVVGLEENTNKLKNNHLNLQACRRQCRMGKMFFCEGRKGGVEAELLSRKDWVIQCVLVSNNSYMNKIQ